MQQMSTNIINKPTDSLIPYVNNARTHSEQQVLQIAASIKEFGFTNPVLIDGDNGIIAGHGRVMAAQKLGLEEVPTIELSHLSEAQKKAYILADNKIALNAGWDQDLLKLEFDELKELGFDELITGFNADELSALNYEAIDIDEVEKFNDKFNIQIKCDDLIQVSQIQDLLGITGNKIDASKVIEAFS